MPSPQSAGAKRLLDEHPCKKEHQASLQCAATSNREACVALFKEYKACMKAWQTEARAAKFAERA
jgi:hypothetical protein